MKDQLSIGRVAEIVRMNVPTIRYYEEIGLMPAVLRTETTDAYTSKRMFGASTSFAMPGNSVST